MMDFVRKNLLLVVAALVILVGGGWYVVDQNKNTPEQNTQTSQEKKTQATITVDDGTGAKTYTVENVEGKTALEVTQMATSEVEMTGEGTNAYITAINGREASNDKKEYWKLVINGSDAQVGAGSYVVQDGDTIAWEIATY
ncbi:MAG TPA: DUF4430 domain-containing protein [Candidatus Nanoarchaeia archaeon]|nr:hypothetical protein [uncultured archaeon]